MDRNHCKEPHDNEVDIPASPNAVCSGVRDGSRKQLVPPPVGNDRESTVSTGNPLIGEAAGSCVSMHFQRQL